MDESLLREPSLVGRRDQGVEPQLHDPLACRFTAGEIDHETTRGGLFHR